MGQVMWGGPFLWYETHKIKYKLSKSVKHLTCSRTTLLNGRKSSKNEHSLTWCELHPHDTSAYLGVRDIKHTLFILADFLNCHDGDGSTLPTLPLLSNSCCSCSI